MVTSAKEEGETYFPIPFYNPHVCHFHPLWRYQSDHLAYYNSFSLPQFYPLQFAYRGWVKSWGSNGDGLPRYWSRHPLCLLHFKSLPWPLHSYQVSQPLLVPLNYLGGFFNLSKVTNANPAHSAMSMVSSLYRGPFNSYVGYQTSYICFRGSPLSWWPMVSVRPPQSKHQRWADKHLRGLGMRLAAPLRVYWVEPGWESTLRWAN